MVSKPDTHQDWWAGPLAACTSHCLTAQVATFNVNGRPPPHQVDLSQWLRADAEADVLAVGFQEIVPLSAGNVVMGASAHQGRMQCVRHGCELKPDNGLSETPAICDNQASNVVVSLCEPSSSKMH